MTGRGLHGALRIWLLTGALVLLLPWTAIAAPAESASTAQGGGTWSVSYQDGRGSGTWSSYCPPYGVLCNVSISGAVTNTSTSGCYFVQAVIQTGSSVQLRNSPSRCGSGSTSFSMQLSVLRSASVSVRVCREGGGCGSAQRLWPLY
jgi:hypothetical protein